jgi:hypothetical protein
MCFIYIFTQQSVNGRQQTQTQWYYVAYIGSRTSVKIFTNHREAHVDASVDRTVFNFEIILYHNLIKQRPMGHTAYYTSTFMSKQ